jgi:uncharacterized protein (TIGR02145 family)
MILFSCNNKDYDGNVYPIVDIGSQKWMGANLKVTHYRNGDPIPRVTDSATWANLTTGAYCDYNNDPDNAITYGRLYNWYAVNDSRGLAPEGWRIPTYYDFVELDNFLKAGAGDKLKAQAAYHPGWDGINSTLFSALPAGCRDPLNYADYWYLGSQTWYWTSMSDELDAQKAYYAKLKSNDYDFYSVGKGSKFRGYSVRCILQ